MSETARSDELIQLRIFISSPGDVAEERDIARRLIDSELPKRPAFRERVALVPVAWDDPAARIPMLATQTPQESVNDARPRPADCDIVVVILWARMGTPLPETIRKPDGAPYLSGTEWEYEDAKSSKREPKPVVLVYRRTEKPKLDIDDPEFEEKRSQYRHVGEFFARFRNADGSIAGGINEYATPAELKTLLERQLEDIIYRRLPDTGERAPVAATIPDAYVDWLRRTYADVSLLGQERQQSHAVTLSHVYVPAATQTTIRWSIAFMTPGVRSRIIPLLQRLDAESLYVPAAAGAGKSTFCRWAVLQSIAGTDIAHPVPAPEEFAEQVPANLRCRLPVLIPLRDFHQEMDCGRGRRVWHRGQLEKAMAAWLDALQPPGLTGALLLAHLNAGSAFLLLDGLDEVPVSETRDGVTGYPRDLLLSGLAEALPAWLKAGNRVLLTSRPYGLDEVGLHRLGLSAAPLEPLPEPLRDLFVARWFHALGKEEQTPGLIATIRGRDDLAPLVDNPMLLTALCVLYDSGGRLPEDRYQLYRRIVDNVLYHRFRDEVREREPARARLEAIALGMHEGDAGSPRLSPEAEISYLDIERLLRAFAAADSSYERGRVEPVAQREDLLTRSGLLLPRPNDRAAFYHLSVQEFLAAERMLRTRDDLVPVFRERAAVAEWRATLLFLFAGKIASKTPRWGADLLARLVENEDRAAVKANPAPAVFIGEALELCLAKKYAVPDALAERFRRLTLDAIEDEVELKSRQALGLCLGRLGDPRIRSLRDPEAYVEMPAGRYPYGEEGKTVEIAEPFRIGRYPVTNGQYAEFIEAGGYRERRWWSADGWAWRQQEKVNESLWWGDRRWNAPNQPVVGVSFWEAEACSAWAGGRLPSEQQWEAAARGPKHHQYPWGDDWEDGICNTNGAALGVTSPVGLFPRSRQGELGIEDLAGNVWEWCASLYGHNDKKKSDVSRVLRGGSWFHAPNAARSASRVPDRPNVRDDDFGFRVVCSSPIFGHRSRTSGAAAPYGMAFTAKAAER
ncbi:Sulphatase-modifying factor protein [uncultured Defluviicoccus sp.]|uniref:Sulphatase-modifying factor protein n=1 Tax=metagenome TaxID=256318 RepID=A0A380TIS0_9ZZZZ|nr:Sulphatase-modifying factor protein [uncultured Defluviicoccus sp.]